MKKFINNTFDKIFWGLCFPFCFFPLSMQAQGPALTEYFQPGYHMRHMLNPALMPQWGYVNFPALGVVSAQVGSNLGLSNFMFPLKNGSIATFLSPEVSTEQFLEGLKEKNYFQISADVSILSAGWYSGRGFWSFDIGVHTYGDANLSYEFFHLIKSQMHSNPTSYHIKDLTANIQGYTSFSLGYARQVNPDWAVGGKLKFLVGLGDVRLNVKNLDVYLSQDKWQIQSDAEATIGGNLMDFVSDSSGKITQITPKWNPVPGGYGAAIDLGFIFKPNQVRGLRFSVGLVDLGFICYRESGTKKAISQGSFEFSGLENIGGSSLGSEVEKMKDDLMNMFNLHQVTSPGIYTRMLNARLNAGLEYDFFMDKFSVGLLSSTLFNKDRITTELTLSLNMKLLEWLSLSVSYSMLQTQQTIGWALNITPKWGLNLFLASDYTPLIVNPQYLPLNKAHMQVMVGLSIPLGNNRLNPYGKKGAERGSEIEMDSQQPSQREKESTSVEEQKPVPPHIQQADE